MRQRKRGARGGGGEELEVLSEAVGGLGGEEVRSWRCSSYIPVISLDILGTHTHLFFHRVFEHAEVLVDSEQPVAPMRVVKR
jgi:hypothetical protein